MQCAGGGGARGDLGLDLSAGRAQGCTRFGCFRAPFATSVGISLTIRDTEHITPTLPCPGLFSNVEVWSLSLLTSMQTGYSLSFVSWHLRPSAV